MHDHSTRSRRAGICKTIVALMNCAHLILRTAAGGLAFGGSAKSNCELSAGYLCLDGDLELKSEIFWLKVRTSHTLFIKRNSYCYVLFHLRGNRSK